jgi:hypothetical protein
LKAQFIQLEHLQFSKVWFYTIQVEGSPMSEFNDFQKRMQLDKKDKSQVAEINRFIKQIGKYYGAQDRYFKREGHAERLPPPTHRFVESDGEKDFGLRLYCIRISDEIVILLNGDRKTAHKVKDCANCKPHFDFANTISDLIFDARQKDLLEFDGFDVLIDDDFEFRF